MSRCPAGMGPHSAAQWLCKKDEVSTNNDPHIDSAASKLSITLIILHIIVILYQHQMVWWLRWPESKLGLLQLGVVVASNANDDYSVAGVGVDAVW